MASKHSQSYVQIPKNLQPYLQDHNSGGAGSEDPEISANPRTLSYLSLAIESNHNVLIAGDEPKFNKEMLKKATSFIPSSESLLIIEKDTPKIDSPGQFFNARALYGKNYPHSSQKQSIIEGMQTNPDWIVVDELCRSEAEALFSAINFGTCFMSTIKCSFIGSDLINKIASKPICIMPERLSSLDVVVNVDGKAGAVRIFEYMWLSRGEIDEGSDVFGKDMFLAKEISELNKENLEKSKVIRRYCEMTGFTFEMSIKELESRSKHIKA